MKLILTAIVLTFCSIAMGQKSSKLQFSLQLQPELTFHQNDYSSRWAEKYTFGTYNLGVSTFIHYSLFDRIFLEGGLGIISRKIGGRAYIDQSRLPPPYYDSTLVLYILKSTSYTTLQVPVGAGIYLFRKGKARFFVKCDYVSNFLLNAKYKPHGLPAFKKNYWQGHSLLGGIGADIRWTKKFIITGALSYSFENTVQRDHYLFSQDEYEIALTHTYLQLSAGIKMNL